MAGAKQFRIDQKIIDALKAIYFPDFPGEDNKFLEWLHLTLIREAEKPVKEGKESVKHDSVFASQPQPTQVNPIKAMTEPWDPEKDTEGL